MFIMSSLPRFFFITLFLCWFHLKLCALASTNVSHSPYVSDICDWQGSGSPSIDSERSVVPIYLRCSRGNVKWLYPKGGLRVLLKLGTSNKNFRGCIRVARNGTRNVRIYIEGKRQLHQLYSDDDGKHKDLLRCFISVNSFMALFIETELNTDRSHSQEGDHVEFSYDLQATTSTSADEADKAECKPCTDEQILSQFCSGDFVLAAKVTYFHHRPELDLTEFSLKPKFMYRFPAYNSYVNNLNTSSTSIDIQQNTLEGMTPLSQVTLHRSLKCVARTEARTEYLFLGRKMLGYYLITCAPKLIHWKHISTRAIEAGTNQCHIT